MNQLLQEKRDAENFLRLIAPKYAAVYILDRSTDTFRDILAPEAFRAFAKDTKGSYSDAMQLYRDHYVACDYQEVIDRVLDYDYVYNILSSGNQVNVTYRKKNGTLIRLKIDRYSDNDENTSIWVYTNEDSEDALYGELGEARFRIRFDDNERPVEFVGSESLSEMLYGFKEPCSSTSLPWTSSESKKSRKAVVASSASLEQYMCSVAQILKESSVTFLLLGSTPSTLMALNLESSKCEKSR